jgi:hypothetical protein
MDFSNYASPSYPATLAATNVRPRRTCETYALQCHACGKEIEIAARPPHRCPFCDRTLQIEWRQG